MGGFLLRESKVRETVVSDWSEGKVIRVLQVTLKRVLGATFLNVQVDIELKEAGREVAAMGELIHSKIL